MNTVVFDDGEGEVMVSSGEEGVILSIENSSEFAMIEMMPADLLKVGQRLIELAERGESNDDAG